MSTLRNDVGVDEGPALVVRDLGFVYRGQRESVLHDVDLDLIPFQSVGVLGPNGAGKSTLLRAITSTVDGTRKGSVEVRSNKSLPRSIGYAMQDVALYPTLTVRENIEHVARLLLNRHEVGVAIDQTVEDFKIQALVDRRAHTLSGGQRRIAHLAVSFVHNPPVRFLDEPTTALDFETRAHLIELIKSWRAGGCSVLITAHYPEDIEELCTHLVLIRAGTVRPLGSLHEFLARQRQEAVVRTSNEYGHHQHILAAPRISELIDGLRALTQTDEVLGLELSSTRLRAILMRDPSLSAYLPADGSTQ